MSSRYTTADYMNIFMAIDTNNNGFISIGEFKNYMISKKPFSLESNPAEAVEKALSDYRKIDFKFEAQGSQIVFVD